MGFLAEAMRHLPASRPSREQTLLNTERLGAVAHLMSSIEYLIEPWYELPRQATSWASLQAMQYRFRSPVTRKIFGLAADRRVITGLHAARAGASLALLAPTGRKTRLAANAFLAATDALLYPHESYGTDGSDQASFLAQTGAAVARALPNRPALTDAALWYLAAQSTLSYTIAGWAKLLGPDWRNGEALPGVLRTYTYGDRQAYQLARRFPRASRLVGASVLALECFFPAAYLGKGRLAPVFVGSAAAFHVANARLMGLHRFLPAFLALHPSLLYTAGAREAVTRSGETERRDDLFPMIMAAGGAAAVAGAVRTYQRRRRMVVRGRTGEKQFTTTTGNVLTFRRSGSEDETTPLVVIEGGLAVTIEQNAWLEQHLGSRYGVLSYQRAGYGSSKYRRYGEYTLDVALRDLTDLVADQAGNRPVVLLGHSLGGYLSWLAVPRLRARLGDRLKGIALLDSTHPDELNRSPAQFAGALFHDRHFDEVSMWMRCGLGFLTDRPGFVDKLPEEVRELVAAQYADPGMWTAARREWKAVRAYFGRPEARLKEIDVPAVVLTAERTARIDAVQIELHDEMARSATWAHRHIVAGTGHDSIVVEREPSARAAELVAAFIDEAMTGTGHDVDTTPKAATEETSPLTATITAATSTDRLPVRTV